MCQIQLFKMAMVVLQTDVPANFWQIIDDFHNIDGLTVIL